MVTGVPALRRPPATQRFIVLAGLKEGERVIKEPGLLTPGELIRVRSVDGKPVEDEEEGPGKAEESPQDDAGAARP